MTTPPNAHPDASQIAQEIRAGLKGVTPGWELAEPLSGNVRKDGGYSLISMPNSDITAFREIANFGPHKADAWHAWHCSPGRIAILLDAFDAQAKEIAELQAALEKRG